MKIVRGRNRRCRISDSCTNAEGCLDWPRHALRFSLRRISVTALAPAFAAILKRDSLPAGAEPVTGDAIHALTVYLMRGLAAEKPVLLPSQPRAFRQSFQEANVACRFSLPRPASSLALYSTGQSAIA